MAHRFVNDKSLAPDDQPFETAEEAFNRAWSAVGQPWLAPASRTQMVQFAGSTKKSTKAQRLGRQLLLRSMLLAGPDAQVM
mgnify:CR=1 FL=1